MQEEPLKLQKAKTQLIMSSPFFATQIFRMPMVQFTDTQKEMMKAKGFSATLATDGKNMYYTPEFIDTMTVPQIQGAIAHNLLHICYFHNFRRGHREAERWDQATDYSINWILKSSGMTLPAGALDDPQYHNMTAEEIYEKLQQKGKGKGQGQNGQGGQGNQPGQGWGQVMDAPGDMNEAESTQQVKEMLAQAANAARQQGKLPAELERMVTSILDAKVPWQEVLARFLVQPTKNDYDFRRVNRRYIGTGFVLPELHSESLEGIWMFVDTSGSIQTEELNKFAAEIQAIVSQFNAKVDVLYIDAAVAGEPQTIEPDEAVELEPKGGGGTDFAPGFQWLEKEGTEPTCVVYFTDGYCSSYAPEPAYPVLWCIYGGLSSFNPPYGEVIYVD